MVGGDEREVRGEGEMREVRGEGEQLGERLGGRVKG